MREPLAPYANVEGPVVVDTNVLIDILNDHPVWARWSAMLTRDPRRYRDCFETVTVIAPT